jgi:diguanylate cyclase (GGDEF)-like protein
MPQTRGYRGPIRHVLSAARVPVSEPVDQDSLPLLFDEALPAPTTHADRVPEGAAAVADDAGATLAPGADGSAPRRRRPWWAKFLAVQVALVLGAVSGVFGALEPTAILLASCLTIGGAVYSIRRYRPTHVWTYWTVTVALFVFVVAALARVSLATTGNLSASRSLIPDLISLPGYVVLATGLLGFCFARSSSRERPLGVVLDGVIAALALLALAWVFLMEPLLLHFQTPMPVRLVLCCYPAASIFLVVLTFRIAFSPDQERRPAYWLLLGAMMCMFIGDAMYMFAEIHVLHLSGRFLDFPYALAYLGAAAMMTHPSMRALTEPVPPTRRKPVAGRTLIVAVALLVPALLVLDRPVTGALRERFALFGIIVVLTGAAVLRIVQALHTAERSEALMAHQAMHDSLTGLPNRRMVTEHLTRVLQRTPIDDTHVALLFLDLDRFKLVNDTLGHTQGDQLLISVGRRLQDHVRSTDLVTRIGGDEFMIVLGEVASVSHALDMANRLRSCLREPFVVNGTEFYVSASVGLSFAAGDDPTTDAEVLVREADTAMYQAKDAGRDSVAVFDESMRAKVSERVELEKDLRHAVDRHQLHLVYQPILALPHGPVIGVEALVRWAHPTLGVISPAKFIPLAEENGLIGDIGTWVMEEALHQLSVWRHLGPHMRDLHVAVNLSAAQLHDESLVERVGAALARHELEGPALCLELTESVVMDDPVAAVAVLSELRQLGIKLAIDDFGTEYSSLAYLKRFPVSSLKIDKSFVDSLVEEDSSDATLVAAVVAMAHALGVTTIAEGVEHQTQAQRLIELGCDAVQGYLFSRPVRTERVADVVEALWEQSTLAQVS